MKRRNIHLSNRAGLERKCSRCKQMKTIINGKVIGANGGKFICSDCKEPK